MKVALLYSNDRTAEVVPGDTVQHEDVNGVRSRMIVRYLCELEPMLMGWIAGTELTVGCRSDRVVSVESAHKSKGKS